MQDNITSCSDNTSNRQSICATGLHQNLNRAFVLFELTPANEISLLDPYERTLGKCCVDPLRAPVLSECGFLPRTRFGPDSNRTVYRELAIETSQRSSYSLELLGLRFGQGRIL